MGLLLDQNSSHDFPRLIELFKRGGRILLSLSPFLGWGGPCVAFGGNSPSWTVVGGEKSGHCCALRIPPNVTNRDQIKMWALPPEGGDLFIEAF